MWFGEVSSLKFKNWKFRIGKFRHFCVRTPFASNDEKHQAVTKLTIETRNLIVFSANRKYSNRQNNFVVWGDVAENCSVKNKSTNESNEMNWEVNWEVNREMNRLLGDRLCECLQWILPILRWIQQIPPPHSVPPHFASLRIESARFLYRLLFNFVLQNFVERCGCECKLRPSTIRLSRAFFRALQRHECDYRMWLQNVLLECNSLKAISWPCQVIHQASDNLFVLKVQEIRRECERL